MGYGLLRVLLLRELTTELAADVDVFKSCILLRRVASTSLTRVFIWSYLSLALSLPISSTLSTNSHELPVSLKLYILCCGCCFEPRSSLTSSSNTQRIVSGCLLCNLLQQITILHLTHILCAPLHLLHPLLFPPKADG